ncbi:hydrogenase maturation protease [Picosynechococcus sp. NKBG042902]|uniref:hydrogenase maturation protease n=1 Tax=Picosynechococcus sp. NKBG042902 TaxID=490193 RepID=UPI0004A9F9C1|nr:hydrogenase maturation protease [Picosynechococcus sp. NKBG042902]
MTQTLMIGYGNTLRSDDGAGQKVSEAFFDQENIKAIATHQLTPELVEDLVQVEQVYFIDAAPVETVMIKPIQRGDNEHNFGHFIDPKSLLNLAQEIYHYVPDAYLVLIPAQDFKLGENYSDITQKAIETAIHLLQERLTPCMK